MARADRGPVPAHSRALRGYTDLTVLHVGVLWTVYRAFDIETAAPVAMTVIKAGSVEDYLTEELAADMERLRLVKSHPNIASLYRFLRNADGSATVVTELCPESFADRAARGETVPVADIAGLGCKIASGLAAAHQVGLIHRDVRPSTVLLARSGEPLLAGFGLGRVRFASRSAASPVGPHTAPELFSGGEPSPATDVYGLAATLFELLAGRPPFEAFDGEAPASLILRIVGQPVPVVHLGNAPIALMDLLARSMAKDPADRPTSPRELAAELVRLGPPLAAGPDSGGPPAGPSPSPDANVRAVDPPGGPVARVNVRSGARGIAMPRESKRNLLTPITLARYPRSRDSDVGSGPALPPG